MAVVVIFGASGDLAKRKILPSLFTVFCDGLLDSESKIIGFSRTQLSDEDFRNTISESISKGNLGSPANLKAFLTICTYFTGNYDNPNDYLRLGEKITSYSHENGSKLFYLAVPPSVFMVVAKNVSKNLAFSGGNNKIIIEKPFGRDLETSKELNKNLSLLFDDDDLFRIDHYLGKEMTKNIVTFRFGNTVFDYLWSANTISNVQIVFKEKKGIENRVGYFETNGIIRDVMQNHLMQLLSLVGMNNPKSLDPNGIHTEKVKVPELEDVVVAQYINSKDNVHPSYKQEVENQKSVTPTFALVCFYIDDVKWKGVPFLIKCGKGLDEDKVEIRIQFKDTENKFWSEKPARDELVLRLQPKEVIYLKTNCKSPGESEDIMQTELDLTYHTRYQNYVPRDAYVNLLTAIMKNNHSVFVNPEEIDEAWRILTPILSAIDAERIPLLEYNFGSRGPKEADEFVKMKGYERTTSYKWPQNN